MSPFLSTLGRVTGQWWVAVLIIEREIYSELLASSEEFTPGEELFLHNGPINLGIVEFFFGGVSLTRAAIFAPIFIGIMVCYQDLEPLTKGWQRTSLRLVSDPTLTLSKSDFVQEYCPAHERVSWNRTRE
jgi:hypothetical protein